MRLIMDTNVSPMGYTQYMQVNIGQKLRLIVMEEGGLREYDLQKMRKDRLFFGRDEESCDIVISNRIISRVHGKIKMDGGKMYVADMGSTNGIFLYGKKYQKMTPKQYYVKNTGDMILKIQGTVDGVDKTVLLIFTKSTGKGVWRTMNFSSLPMGTPLTIGRAPENVLSLDSPSLSRQHASIIRQGNGYILYDHGSMNGVFVNGERIQGQKSIADTDVIQIAGKYFLLQNGQLLYEDVGTGISLSLENITKVVDHGKKKILDHVFCDIESNEFVAIIGGSGAGKTTVMTAMSGFDKQILGSVLCNGIDLHKNFSALKNMIGFVPQQDIIYENLTLYSMLSYTAKLKMPSDSTKEEREKRIYQVLDMVDLRQKAGTYIRKLSGGQKKRASIAVELLADPGLFFLDEPTSGLDPDTEQSLMHTLSQLSKSEGKTIIMVTHTIQSIHLCDKVIFMGAGGRICYCGSPKEITSYFQKNSLVEVYNELAEHTDLWNRRYLQQYMLDRGQRTDTGSENQNELAKRQKNSKQVSFFRQMGVLTARYFHLIWNDKQRLILLMLQPLLISLLLNVVADRKFVFKAYDSTKSIMFALTCSGIWIGLFNTIQEICKERPILKREYMGNLKLPAYMLSKYIVQGVLCLVQSVIISTIFLVSMKHAPHKPLFLATSQLEVWVTMFLVIYASAALGLIVSAFVKNADRAMAIAPFVLIIQLLFSGVLFELKGAADKISYITVSRYGMQCLGGISRLNQLNMKDDNPMFKTKKMPHGHETYAMFKHTFANLVGTWWILIGIAVLCGIVSIIVLQSLKNEQR